MNLPTNHIIQYPSGRWGFVGAMHAELAYITKDGGTPTERQLHAAKLAGPAVAGLKTRSWATKEDAIEAAKALGQEVTLPKEDEDEQN
jgi:hypothetical protein